MLSLYASKCIDIVKIVLILSFWCVIGFGIFSVACQKDEPITERTPEEKVDMEARFRSTLPKIIKTPSPESSLTEVTDLVYEVVTSGTGKQFYRGELCPRNCEAYVLGYTWANELGITKIDACKKIRYNPRLSSLEYSMGCEAAMLDNILDR